MVLSILEMVLPVLFVIALGWMSQQRGWLSAEEMRGVKGIVSRFALPAVLFNAFLTANYTATTLITFLVVYIALGLALAGGFWLRKFNPQFAKFMPFLLTGFEGGMLGYSLYGLLYGASSTHVFAMADIGQTFFAFTLFLSTLRVVNGQKRSAKAIDKTMLTNPPGLSMLAGIVLGASGLGSLILSLPIGGTIKALLSFLGMPTSVLILLVVGYDLSFKRSIMKPVMRTVLLRLAIMVLLCAACAFSIFALTPFDKSLLVALMLGFSLPAPFIIPLYADVAGHGEYISTTLSVTTLISIAMFVCIAAYSLA